MHAQPCPACSSCSRCPGNVRDYYAARLKKRFPELEIDVADHFSKASRCAPNADILLTFGPMMRDEVFANAPKLKWVQALGTGVDGITDQPSLGKHVTVTNIRGIHGAPVSEAAIMGMLALSRDLPRSVRSQDAEQLDALAAAAARQQDRRHLRHRADRGGAGAALQGVRHDGLGFTSTKREVPGFDRMLLRERADRDCEGARLSRPARPLLRRDATFDRRATCSPR